MRALLARKTGEAAPATLALEVVQPTSHPDGLVRFGDVICIESEHVQGILSVDPANQFNPSCSTLVGCPCARNSFIIEPCPEDHQTRVLLLSSRSGSDRSLVRYGLPFRLRLLSSITGSSAVYLSSQALQVSSSSVGSRVRKQLLSTESVEQSKQPSYCCNFKFQSSAVSTRFESEGEPITQNSGVVVVHCASGQMVECDGSKSYTEYGCEFGVQVHTALSTGSAFTLLRELEGTTTADISQKPEQTSNHWRVVNQYTFVDTE